MIREVDRVQFKKNITTVMFYYIKLQVYHTSARKKINLVFCKIETAALAMYIMGYLEANQRYDDIYYTTWRFSLNSFFLRYGT